MYYVDGHQRMRMLLTTNFLVMDPAIFGPRISKSGALILRMDQLYQVCDEGLLTQTNHSQKSHFFCLNVVCVCVCAYFCLSVLCVFVLLPHCGECLCVFVLSLCLSLSLNVCALVSTNLQKSNLFRHKAGCACVCARACMRARV